MKINKKSLLCILMIFIIIALIILAILYKYYNRYKNSDEYKFKKEYENLNTAKNANGDYKYIKLNIPMNNKIVYENIDGIFDILNNKTGIIYFGKPDCPWCRNIINILIKTANKNNINSIYYYNPEEIRNQNTLEYQKLIKHLNQYLDTDTTTQNKNDINFDVNKKRLYLPDVYFVKNGTIVGNHIGSVDSQKDPHILLSNEQEKELEKIYTDLIKKMLFDTCNDNKIC